MASLVVTVLCNFLSLGNILALLFVLLVVHQLSVLYEFRSMPPGPRITSLPVLGNVFSLDFKAKRLTDAFQSLRKNYGHLFSSQFGSYKFVMCSTPESVKEMLVTKSADFAGRPQTYFMEEATLGGKDIVFGNYGPSWMLHRKLFTSSLRRYLSDIPLIESRVSEQVVKLLQYMEKQDSKPFDPAPVLRKGIADVTSGIAFGQGYDTSHPTVSKLLHQHGRWVAAVADAQLVVMLDFFWFARYLPLKAYERSLDYFNQMHEIILEHVKEREKIFDPEAPVMDFISGLLQARSVAECESAEERAALLSDVHIINTIRNMFVAGYESTSTTLKWVVAYLVTYPKYQREIQQQLDEVVGERAPCLDDRQSLPLIQATIIESLRLGNVVPLAVAHLTLNDTTICGYRVPKDTIVFPDTESVHLDPNCWDNPTVFDPYRHIDEDGELVTNQGNFYPFGAGRRFCPGEALAKTELFLFTAWMLQRFTLVPEEDGRPPSLKGIYSITQYPPPFKIRAIKRK